jgi:hypothetical protein
MGSGCLAAWARGKCLMNCVMKCAHSSGVLKLRCSRFVYRRVSDVLRNTPQRTKRNRVYGFCLLLYADLFQVSPTSLSHFVQSHGSGG